MTAPQSKNYKMENKVNICQSDLYQIFESLVVDCGILSLFSSLTNSFTDLSIKYMASKMLLKNYIQKGVFLDSARLNCENVFPLYLKIKGDLPLGVSFTCQQTQILLFTASIFDLITYHRFMGVTRRP